MSQRLARLVASSRISPALSLWSTSTSSSSSSSHSWTSSFACAIGAAGATALAVTMLPSVNADDVVASKNASSGVPQPLSNAEKKESPGVSKKDAHRGKNIMLFSGNGNPQLANEIASNLGCELGQAKVTSFKDGEISVLVGENVRGKDVYIVQPTCPPNVNNNLMELMLMISTMRRASARRITAVIPYYGYARQDRKLTARVPISAADVARLLEAMGVDRVIAVDLHCGQIQGFFSPRVPVDNLAAGSVGVEYFRHMDLHNPVILSPDAGGVQRAKTFRDGMNAASHYDCGLAMIIKQRAKANAIESMDLVGSVENCDVIVVDDMVDTAGTLCSAAKELKAYGANRVFAFMSHGLFSGPAASRIRNSELEEVVVVNSVPLPQNCKDVNKIKQLSVAPLLAEAIRRVHQKQSVSGLFKYKQ